MTLGLARRWWKSTTAHFVALQLAVCLACVLPALLVIYTQTDRILLRDFQKPMEVRKDNLFRHYARGGVAELTTAVRSRERHGLSDGTALLLLDPEGRRVAGNIVAWPEGSTRPASWRPLSLQRDTETHSEPFLVLTTRFPSGHILLLGGSLSGRIDMQAALLFALAAALALAAPIALVGSIVIVRKMNGMVDTVAAMGQHIAAGDLSRRLDIDGSGDPLDRLRGSVNAMLARIETLVEELRMLTDALAHDIRSPLTRISAHIERARRLPSGGGQLESVDAISREVTSLLRMLESALEIGRAEAGIGRDDFEVFDGAEVLSDLCELYRPLAAEKDVRMTFATDGQVGLLGNRSLLARAVANLIDNAIKYGAQGGSVEVCMSHRPDGVTLSVSDRGGGIAADRQHEAVRKFGRLDGARNSPGSGLGLALVNAVAQLHGGHLTLDDNRPGLRATLWLRPASEPGIPSVEKILQLVR